MNTIFMNSENSKTSNPYRILLSLSDKMNLSRNDTFIAWWSLIIYCSWKNIKNSYKNNKFFISPWSRSNLTIYYTCKNIKNSYKINKFKMSVPTFELLYRSYFVSDIQDYFEYIIKKHEKVVDNLLIRI